MRPRRPAPRVPLWALTAAILIVLTTGALVRLGALNLTGSHVRPSPSGVAQASPSPLASASPSPAATPLPVGSGGASPAPPPSGRPATPQPSPPPSPASLDCSQASLDTATTTDHPSYVPGAQVTITVTITNHSSVSCSYASDYPCHYNWVTVADSQGNVAWISDPSQQKSSGFQPCPEYPQQQLNLSPGASASFARTWNQRYCGPQTCSNAAVPAGTYTARGYFAENPAGSAAFTITGS